MPAAAPELIKGLVRYFGPSALGNMVLHRLDEPGTHWYHLLPRHANVHVVVIHLRIHRRHGEFGSCNHRFCGGLVPTSSSRRGGRRKGRSGGFAPGMLSETACGLLLLLLGGVAVALAVNTFTALPHWLWGQSHRL